MIIVMLINWMSKPVAMQSARKACKMADVVELSILNFHLKLGSLSFFQFEFNLKVSSPYLSTFSLAPYLFLVLFCFFLFLWFSHLRKMIFPHFSSDIMQRVTSAPSPLLIVSWYFMNRYFLATWNYSLTTHFSLEAPVSLCTCVPQFIQCLSLSPFSNLFLRNRQSQGWIGDSGTSFLLLEAGQLAFRGFYPITTVGPRWATQKLRWPLQKDVCDNNSTKFQRLPTFNHQSDCKNQQSSFPNIQLFYKASDWLV